MQNIIQRYWSPAKRH